MYGDATRSGQFVPPPPEDLWDLLLRVTIIAGLAGLVWFSLRSAAFAPLLRVAQRHGITAILIKPSVAWFSMGSTLLLLRTLLWFRYKPFAAANLHDAPSMTVIIPAYNEGAMVAHAIDSVALARYPRDRLQLIVVDDGSTDDTWAHIERAHQHHGNRIETLRFDRNCGKREALAAGFRRASGDIVVTVDSDSVVERDALLALAGPFSRANVGVVSGRVLVYNRREGIIPRMLHVRFVLAFDFLRAYQSTFGTVYCSPGALSAYRASAVRKVLDAWLGQRFLGAPATYGEDRALTNDIMRLGFDSVYQRNASVLTIVPTTYLRLCRMFLRWERSFVREEVRFLRVVWKRPPVARTFALLDVFTTNLRYPVLYASLLLLSFAVVDDPASLLRTALAVASTSLIYSLYYLRSERSMDLVFGVVFGFFSLLCLWWIPAYALTTVRAQGWLTR